MPVCVCCYRIRPWSPFLPYCSHRTKSSPPSRIPTPLLIPRPYKSPDLLTPPINAIPIPVTPPRHLDERRVGKKPEAGQRAREAVVVRGGALFVEEGVDAVVGVLGWEGAVETETAHAGL